MDDLQAQLIQLHAALAVAEDEDKAGILAIIDDLQSLIPTLNDDPAISNENSSAHLHHPDDEFLRFQKELLEMESASASNTDKSHRVELAEETDRIPDSDTSSSSATDTGINEELDALVGMSCMAPFIVQWGQIGYYNAVVFSVEPHNPESADGINVRVIFTQPLSTKMRTCPYFLSGSCRFEEDCKFSHGQIVPLSHLKDYKEPNFSTLTKGSRVLAKYSDDLWYFAVIGNITDSGDCELTYENYGEQVTVPLHDTQPLDQDIEEDEDDFENSESSNCSDTEASSSTITDEVPIVWVHMRGTSALGVWEQHTRGMGSKLMAKMGYVFGSGLGKNAEGRVEPVDAVILPPGRSLDTVMQLKEKAGKAGNLFSAERHLKRLQKKKKEQDAKLEKKEQQSQSMFNFLNSQLNTLSKDKRNHRPVSETMVTAAPHKESEKSLNKQLLSVTESIRQIAKEKAKCQESLKRHQGRDETTVKRISEKLNHFDSQLAQLKRSEERINNEQQHRNDKRKLTIF